MKHFMKVYNSLLVGYILIFRARYYITEINLIRF